MQEFVDRTQELATLEREYKRNEASFVVVYGRRRVGKTSLISHFIRNKRAIYYLATEESEAQNRQTLQEVAATVLHDEMLKSASFERWEPLFTQICNAAQSGERIVIVIDEFQYLGQYNKEFISVFQRIWDTILSRSNIMLIICGSLVSMMESQVLDYSSPLYGRRTAQIKLQQIPFSYYHEFFPALTQRERIERYALTGGVPKYIEQIERDSSLEDIFRNEILNTNSFLYDEPLFLLRGEVSDVGTYFSVLKTIAAGNHKTGDIARALQIPVTAVPSKLQTLRELGFVERQVPVTEKNLEKSKKGLYYISDNFIDFWFRFVFPLRSYIESGHSKVALTRIMSQFTVSHVAYVYEQICRDAVWDLAAKNQWNFLPTSVGRWWGARDVEIDVVAIDELAHNICFGECKYWNEPVGANVLHSLEKKKDAVNWQQNTRKESFAIFSASGFADQLQKIAKQRDDVILVDTIEPDITA